MKIKKRHVIKYCRSLYRLGFFKLFEILFILFVLYFLKRSILRDKSKMFKSNIYVVFTRACKLRGKKLKKRCGNECF